MSEIHIKYVHNSDASKNQESMYSSVEAKNDNEAAHPELLTDYTSEDVTPQRVQEKVNAQSRAYLASTDWYVVRFAETATAIPGDITTTRAAARAAIVG